MTGYVVLLRGINVGRRVIRMAELKACLEKLGLDDVKTVLQSGNVVFKSDKSALELKSLIEKDLTETFKYPAKVWVLTVDKLREIIDANPFAGAPENFHQYVIFFENGLEMDFAAEADDLESEAVQAGKSVAYWKVEKGQTLKSARGKILSKAKYRGYNTNRNINTLKKLTA